MMKPHRQPTAAEATPTWIRAFLSLREEVARPTRHAPHTRVLTAALPWLGAASESTRLSQISLR